MSASEILTDKIDYDQGRRLRRLWWRIQLPFIRLHERWKWRGCPPALVKACEDPFDYALGLNNGRVVFFETAELRRPFVHLSGVTETTMRFNSNFHSGIPNFERGVDIRLADISWVADAPYGS